MNSDLVNNDLLSPGKRDFELTYEEYLFPTSGCTYLSIPNLPREASFWAIIEGRRSRRNFGVLDEESLSGLLWYSMKTRLSQREPSGFLWQGRPSPSGGGRHPVDTVIIDYRNGRIRARLYDPIAHALLDIVVADAHTAEIFMKGIELLVPVEEGTVVWFIAQFGRTMAKYIHGESLVWRDAGALLATFCFVAEGLGLACCGIGITGDPEIPAIFGNLEKLRGVGGCIIGSQDAAPR